MKTLAVYKKLGLLSNKDVFNHLIATLKKSNTTWDYFVNWAKVFGGIKSIEVDLNILNYLNGEDPDDILQQVKLKNPCKEDPEVLMKAYKWIWGQEDCNYPPPLQGRDMSMKGIMEKKFCLINQQTAIILPKMSHAFFKNYLRMRGTRCIQELKTPQTLTTFFLTF